MEKTGKSTGERAESIERMPKLIPDLEKNVTYSQPSVESMNRGRTKAGRNSKNRAILRKWRKRP